MEEALALLREKKIDAAMNITHIGGLDAVVDTTLYLKKMPGEKKIIYTHISMPLTAIEDFRKLGKDDPLFEQLADACDEAGGFWNKKAEDILLNQHPKAE